MSEPPFNRAVRFQKRQVEAYTELEKTRPTFRFQLESSQMALEALNLIQELGWEHILFIRTDRNNGRHCKL